MHRLPLAFLAFALSLSLAAFSSKAVSETIRVAVAANFYKSMEALAVDFEMQTEHSVQLINGSSGKLAAQILQGAPIDLFLSADTDRPKELERRGRIVDGTRQTYAFGRLALVSRNQEVFEDLQTGELLKLAIANPQLAPYGLAAQQVVQKLYAEGEIKLVYGENVSQAFHFFQTGNVDFAMVAFSQLSESDEFYFEAIPQNLYEPIEQQMVQIKNNGAAKSLYDYLLSERAQEIIANNGYGRLRDY